MSLGLLRTVRFVVGFLAGLGLVYVVAVPIRTAGGFEAFFTTDTSLQVYAFFKLSGIVAFYLVSLQVVTGPLMRLWERLYGRRFYRFHAWQGVAGLFFSLLHPILLGVYLLMSSTNVFFFASHYGWPFWLGPAGLALMILAAWFAIQSVFIQKERFLKKYLWLHLGNYLVFLLIFIHSIQIGGDTAGELRPFWYILLFAGVLAFLYRRAYVVWKDRQQTLSDGAHIPEIV